MKKVTLTLMAAMFALGAFAQTTSTTQQADKRQDMKDLRHDTRDIRHDKAARHHELKNGHTQMAKATTKDIRADKKDRNADVKDLKADGVKHPIKRRPSGKSSLSWRNNCNSKRPVSNE